MSILTKYKDLSLPVMAAPMFLISGPDLVIACCKAGIIGTFPALNQRTTDGLDRWLTYIESQLVNYVRPNDKNAPFGVNLVVHKSNVRLEADLEILIQHKVPIVITSLGTASNVIKRIKAYGGLVFHDVTTVRHARKAAAAGVDGLIAVAAGAGGHAGTSNPFALIGEIRQFFDKTVILAGAISTGRDIAAVQVMGADLAYMGTRFLATKESLANNEYKSMLLESSANDIVYTPAISSVPASFLRQSIIQAGFDPDNFKASAEINLDHITRPYMINKGDNTKNRPWRDIWSAGQGVGNITDVPSVDELVGRLEGEYKRALSKVHCLS